MSTKEVLKTDDTLNLTPEVAKLSSQLIKKLVVSDDGTITPDKKLHEELLPEGMTADTLKQVQAHYSNLLAASAHAVGTLAQDFLKKHKKIEEVHMDKFHIGRDSIRVNYKRSVEVGGIGGAKTTKHGWITAKLTTGAAGSGAGQFGRIRQHFAEQGASLFS